MKVSAVIAYYKGAAVELKPRAPFYIKDFNHNLAWVKKMLDEAPTARIRGHLATAYAKTYNSETALTPERSANINLRKTVAHIKSAVAHLPMPLRTLANRKKRREQAKEYALLCNQMQIVNYDENTTLDDVNAQIIRIYKSLCDFVESKSINPPYKTTVNHLLKKNKTESAADYAEYAVRRMVCAKWWERKLQRMRDTALEHINIIMGFVYKRVSPYVSRDCLSEYRAARTSQDKWLKTMQLVSECGEFTVPLDEVFKGSVANPEIRRIELMVRVRGYDEYAEQSGMDAVFYTVTAPSKYHRSSKKYNGCMPSETQAYLTKQWAKVRATLAKESIKLFGLRVVEPHHDATPHWHLLLFMNPKHKTRINEVIRHFALQDDGDESGASKHRFKAEDIDRARGSAVGYIAKYISKNINANHIKGENDNETNREFSDDSALSVGAWASRWRIRQFQFVGGAPVGIWRELRRASASDVVALGEQALQAFHAADSSKYAEFLAVMGGAEASRKELLLKIKREQNGFNDYHEEVSRVVGLEASAGASVITRLSQWKIEKRSDSGATWSTGNNCNSLIKRQLPESEIPHFLKSVPREARASVLLGMPFYDYQGGDIKAHYIKDGYFKTYSINQGHLCH